MSELSRAAKLAMCSGCSEDFYNDHNPYGIKECWNLKTATVALKNEVHVDQLPPWKNKPQEFLSCFRRPRHVYVRPDQEF